jgi:hypothetical protein
MSLELRESCERCGAALAPDGEAYICSHECTFCGECLGALEETCPNCGGELVRRPRRAAAGA